MQCPFCQQPDTQVKDSRPVFGTSSIKRRRVCTKCHAKFTTLEKIELREVMVVKKDGTREAFDEMKLFYAIKIACRKRPLTDTAINDIVERIRYHIERNNESEVGSQLIGQLAMHELQSMDEVAYVRYASVYNDFSSKEEFLRFIKSQ